jgi:hypothetical protein
MKTIIKNWHGSIQPLKDAEMTWGITFPLTESGVLQTWKGRLQSHFQNADMFDAFNDFIRKHIIPEIKKTAERNFKKFFSGDTSNFISANQTYTKYYQYEGKTIIFQMRGSYRNLRVVCSLVDMINADLPAENTAA